MLELAEARGALEVLLAKANGRRRARTLSLGEVEQLAREAAASATGVAFRHGGSSDPRARTTLCLAVVNDGVVTAGVAELTALDPDPGRAWAELRPWNPHLLEANVAHARAWAARAGDDRVAWRLPKPARRDGEALLAAVLEHPEEDAPRLVYADWLTEQGDPRGELIAVQCRLARLPAQDPSSVALLTRQLELLNDRGAMERSFPGLLGPGWRAQLLPQGRVGIDFGGGIFGMALERGFVRVLSIDQQHLGVLGRVLAREPVRELRILTLPEDGARLAALRSFGCVRRLTLEGGAYASGLQPEGLSLLLESRELGRLEVLELNEQQLEDLGVMQLAARGPEVLPALSGLRIAGDTVSAVAIEMLAATRWFRRLTSVAFDHVGLDWAGVSALVSGGPTQWESLALDHDGLTLREVKLVFEAPVFSRLKRLSLQRNNLNHVAPVLASPLLGALELLSLQGNPLSDSARQVLRARLNGRVALE